MSVGEKTSILWWLFTRCTTTTSYHSCITFNNHWSFRFAPALKSFCLPPHTHHFPPSSSHSSDTIAVGFPPRIFIVAHARVAAIVVVVVLVVVVVVTLLHVHIVNFRRAVNTGVPTTLLCWCLNQKTRNEKYKKKKKERKKNLFSSLMCTSVFNRKFLDFN